MDCRSRRSPASIVTVASAAGASAQRGRCLAAPRATRARAPPRPARPPPSMAGVWPPSRSARLIGWWAGRLVAEPGPSLLAGLPRGSSCLSSTSNARDPAAMGGTTSGPGDSAVARPSGERPPAPRRRHSRRWAIATRSIARSATGWGRRSATDEERTTSRCATGGRSSCARCVRRESRGIACGVARQRCLDTAF